MHIFSVHSGLVGMVFKILNADYTQLPDAFSPNLISLIHSLFHTEPELRPTAKQVLISLNQMLHESTPAKCNTVDDYENDFDSLSDNSTHNLEISQEMATLSVISQEKENDEKLLNETGNASICEISHLSQDQTLISEALPVNSTSNQNGDNYSDDFDSFSESGED